MSDTPTGLPAGGIKVKTSWLKQLGVITDSQVIDPRDGWGSPIMQWDILLWFQNPNHHDWRPCRYYYARQYHDDQQKLRYAGLEADTCYIDPDDMAEYIRITEERQQIIIKLGMVIPH